jgi:hypothetical protein
MWTPEHRQELGPQQEQDACNGKVESRNNSRDASNRKEIQQQQGKNAGMAGTIWTLTAAAALPAAWSTAT